MQRIEDFKEISATSSPRNSTYLRQMISRAR